MLSVVFSFWFVNITLNLVLIVFSWQKIINTICVLQKAYQLYKQGECIGVALPVDICHISQRVRETRASVSKQILLTSLFFYNINCVAFFGSTLSTYNTAVRFKMF